MISLSSAVKLKLLNLGEKATVKIYHTGCTKTAPVVLKLVIREKLHGCQCVQRYLIADSLFLRFFLESDSRKMRYFKTGPKFDACSLITCLYVMAMG